MMIKEIVVDNGALKLSCLKKEKNKITYWKDLLAMEQLL